MHFDLKKKRFSNTCLHFFKVCFNFFEFTSNSIFDSNEKTNKQKTKQKLEW